MPNKIMLTAHAGAENTKPNTRQSIIHCMKSSCDIVEVDVRKVNDCFFLSHDPIDSINGCTSLNEALNLAAHYKKPLNLDLKEAGLYYDLCHDPLIIKNKELIYFSGTVEVEELNKASLENIFFANHVFMNIENFVYQELDYIVDFFHTTKTLGLNIPINKINKLLVSKMKENGILINVWTIDNTREFNEKILPLGIDSITTNNIEEIHELCEKYLIS